MENNNFKLTPYNLEKATIADLKAKYLNVVIKPGDKAAYAFVMAGLRECRNIRKDIDAWHKERKALILKAGRYYDSEKKRVYSLITPIEDSLKSARKAEDDRLQAIKDKERRRVQNIRDKIDKIKSYTPANLYTQDCVFIKNTIEQFSKLSVSEDVYMEFFSEAKQAKDQAMAALTKFYEERKAYEEEQAKAKAEAERLAKERAAQEAERKKLEAEKRAQEEAAKKIREMQEEAQRKIDAEKAEIERQKREERERIERAAFEKEAREKARLAAEKRVREEAERKAAEEARKLAMASDREKLLRFADKIGVLTSESLDIGEKAHEIYDKAINSLTETKTWLIEAAAKL